MSAATVSLVKIPAPVVVPVAVGQIRYYRHAGTPFAFQPEGLVLILSPSADSVGRWSVLYIETGTERLVAIDPATECYPDSGTGAAVRWAATALKNRDKYLCDLLNTERAEHSDFRDKVRELAIETKHAQDWCLDGLNKGLRALGLDEYMPEHDVYVTVRVRATVTAEDESSAVADLLNWVQGCIPDDGDDECITAVESYEV